MHVKVQSAFKSIQSSRSSQSFSDVVVVVEMAISNNAGTKVQLPTTQSTNRRIQ